MSVSNRSVDGDDLKSQAIGYFSLNTDLVKKVEASLNDLFYDSPKDPFGYLAEYFRKFAKTSVISRIESDGIIFYDAKSQPSFKIKIHCIERNFENHILTIDVPCYSNPEQIHDSSRIQQIQEDDARRREELQDSIKFINENLTNSLKTLSPFNQNEIDENLIKVYDKKQKEYTEHIVKLMADELRASNMSVELQQQMSLENNVKKSIPSPKPKLDQNIKKTKSTLSAHGTPTLEQDTILLKHSPYFKGFHTISTISKAICLCAAALNKKQLFLHINELASHRNYREEIKLKLPKPLITILQNGKGFNGKQSLIKEIILVPKPNVSIKEGVELIYKVNLNIRDNLYQSKQQPGAVNRNITDIGCLTCQLDTPQQGLDMIETAINSSCGEDQSKLAIAINIGASELFDNTDPEKLKYEIATGSLKSSDELIEIYADLVNKYPRIFLIIEPFSRKDPLSWYKLFTRIGKQCLIANKFNGNELDSTYNISLLSSNDQLKHHQETTIVQYDDINNPILMPLNFYKFESSLTLSDYIKNFNSIKEKNVLNGVLCNFHETTDSFATDLATGLQATYLKIGGLNRAERVSKINRLLEIEKYLRDNNLIDVNQENDLHEIIETLDFKIPSYFTTLLQQAEEAKLTKAKK